MEACRQELLLAIQTEATPSIRRKICDAVAELARASIGTVNVAPFLSLTLHCISPSCVQSYCSYRWWWCQPLACCFEVFVHLLWHWAATLVWEFPPDYQVSLLSVDNKLCWTGYYDLVPTLRIVPAVFANQLEQYFNFVHQMLAKALTCHYTNVCVCHLWVYYKVFPLTGFWWSIQSHVCSVCVSGAV